MTWINLLLFVHVMAAFLMVGGMVGREITRTQARKTSDLKVFVEMSSLAGRFDTALVRPGSMVVILAGIVLAVVGGWPLLGSLQGGSSNWLLVSILLLLSIIAEIIFIFVPRGKAFEKALQDAVARGEITPELRATFQDPVDRWAHRWEEIAVVLIIYLMIAKPF